MMSCATRRQRRALSSRYSKLRRISFAVIVAALAACAAKPPPMVMPKFEVPTDQILIQGQLVAAPDVNPDPSGQPAPVLVRVYELNSDEVFNGVDFFTLFDHEQAVLGAALLRVRSFQLVPGQAVDISGQSDPRTQFIGVVAAVRDLDRARWRATAPLPPKRARPSEPNRVAASIVVGRGGVGMTVGSDLTAVPLVPANVLQ